MKNLLDAIEEFRKIMTKDKNEDPTSVDSNPLIKAAGTPDQEIK